MDSIQIFSSFIMKCIETNEFAILHNPIFLFYGKASPIYYLFLYTTRNEVYARNTQTVIYIDHVVCNLYKSKFLSRN